MKKCSIEIKIFFFLVRLIFFRIRSKIRLLPKHLGLRKFRFEEKML